MEIQALCEEVNRLITSEGIEIENGRTSSLVTPRNIRYYCTIGIMPPPKRLDSKSTYDESHIEAVMTIKRSQMAGLSLKEIKAQRVGDTLSPVLSEVLAMKTVSSLALNSQEPKFFSDFLAPKFTFSGPPPKSEFGWIVKIRDHELSGFGVRPTDEQLQAIEEILEPLSEANDYWKNED